MTLANEKFMIAESQKVSYAKGLQTEINQQIQDIGRGSNIPPEKLKAVIPLKFVQKNVEFYMTSIYEEVPFKLIETSFITQTLHLTLEKYAQESGLPIANEASEKAFEVAVLDVVQQYVAPPYLLTYAQKVMRYQSTLTLITIIVGVFLLLVTIMLMTLRVVARHIRFRIFAYVFSGSGLMLLVFPAYLYFSGKVQRIGLSSKIMYQFFKQYISDFLLNFIYIGGLCLLVSVFLWLVSENLRRRVVRTRG
ncbi:hypothetical protein [Pseudolactococcus hodotermopsidis]|nr:hypothetical protein [Lactococcus hodotermopsidis]